MAYSLVQRGGRALLKAFNRCLAWPRIPRDFQTRPHPDLGYESARQHVQSLQRAEPATVRDKCRYGALLHQTRTAAVVVFFHGFTNCPQQFHDLGQQLFEKGYNVLLPRLPYHGLANRLTRDLARLTAAELVASVDEAIDIAQGLGERVIAVGISGGAVAVAWAIQQRHDIDHGVLIAPSFGYGSIPAAFADTLTMLFLRLPNLFIWWDRSFKERIPGPTHAYPRLSTRAMGQIFWLGRAVLDTAEHAPPFAPQVSVVMSETDRAVNNVLISELVHRWQDHGFTGLQLHTFPAELGIIHDMIDPDQTAQQIDVVYPVLIDLITNGVSPTTTAG